MKAPDVITIDFETLAIEGRPSYPPEPVGVAIKYGREKSHYYAWGHPTANNCTVEDGVFALSEAFARPERKLFHHAKFDLAVLVEKLGFDAPSWDEVDDTMFLAFLFDPHAKKQGLKDLAEEHLNWPPGERDEVAEWIWEHRKALMETYGGSISRTAKRGDSATGAWIARAPGDIVGKYACGDVDRTQALFDYMFPIIVENGMLEAYNRERQILPIFMENERHGIRVDMESLRADLRRYTAEREFVADALRARLRAPGLNLEARDDLAEVLAREGVIDADKFVYTKTGKRSTAKDNMPPSIFNDPLVASALGYYDRLGTCLSTFMGPWLAQAEINNGRITTNWNQTRGLEGGTRTGRPSTSSHNFLNLAKSFEDKGDGYVHPDALDVPPLPLVRRYVLADEDGVFIHRDFDSQEVRIFADLESGALKRQYLADPSTDTHQFVKEKFAETLGRDVTRTQAKEMNFQGLYGGGAPAYSKKLECSIAEAKEFRQMHHNVALPGLGIVNDEIKRLARSGEPIHTIGGRVYFPEYDENGRDFIYKLLNYYCQGGAADLTKQAVIDWHNHPDRDPSDRFLVTVYDEINISAHRSRWQKANAVLKESMNRRRLGIDIEMRSSPAVGLSWGALKKPKEDKATKWVEPEDEFIARIAKELGL